MESQDPSDTRCEREAYRHIYFQQLPGAIRRSNHRMKRMKVSCGGHTDKRAFDYILELPHEMDVPLGTNFCESIKFQVA
jgi:hypothetical protein